MTLNGIKEIISERLSETCEKLAVIRRRQKGFDTPGNLVIRGEKGYQRYYLRNDDAKGDAKGDRYLGKGDEKTIRELELKHYYNLLEKAACEEVRLLKIIAAKLEKIPDYDKVLGDIPEYRRHMIEPFSILMNPKMSEKWRNMYITNKNIPVDTDYVTGSGVKVRSKSELIIAERFERAGIPYRYEYPVTVGDSLWFPDFLVLNKVSGKEYIWEHFGMADNETYCKSMLEKIEQYAENGMLIGQNLIVTAEGSKHGLSTKYIDRLIDRFLK